MNNSDKEFFEACFLQMMPKVFEEVVRSEESSVSGGVWGAERAEMISDMVTELCLEAVKARIGVLSNDT